MDCWIESFIAYHDNLDSPVAFRRWTAITTIAAALEQKVWLMTSSRLPPNIYTFLVGHPGVGKTRTIRASKAYLLELPDPHMSPTSLTGASLVDALLAAKRMIVRLPDQPLEYNSLPIFVDEVGAFMHKYDNEMVSLLSAFYDPDPYGQQRRGNDLKIKIPSPQVNILAGVTPSTLLDLLPEGSWTQGFTSRIMLIFSDERIIGDDFARQTKPLSPELLHDLKLISAMMGKYEVTEDYRAAVNAWRQLGEPPMPSHPKLIHYNTRRRVHLYKLSMIIAASRSSVLTLTKDDFNTAMRWLLEAEDLMSDVFKAGSSGADSRAMDEIYHYILIEDKESRGLPEAKVVRKARELVPAHSVLRVLEIMERSEMISVHKDRFGQRTFKAVVKFDDDLLPPVGADSISKALKLQDL